MKVAINTCYGGFRLSHKVIMRYAELAGITLYPFTNKVKKNGMYVHDRFMPYDGDEHYLMVHYATKPLNSDGTYAEDSYFSPDPPRNDPLLIQVIEELGVEVNTDVSDIKIVEIPDDIQFEIDDYDGVEHIDEVHRSWY